MKLSYDEQADIMYIDLDEDCASTESDEVAPGFVLDYSIDGRVVGLEIHEAGKKYPGIFSLEKTIV
jgi:uncharacterized protein YuzE